MQTVRGNITRLRSLVEKNVPDGNDVYGYAGISKVDLLSVIDDAYNLSYNLNELEPKFEITLLKRKLTPLIEKCKNILSDLPEEKKKELTFDEIVTKIASIRDLVRLTYIIVVDKGIKSEEYIYSLQEQTDLINTKFNELKESFEAIDGEIESAEAANKKIIDIQATVTSIQNSLTTISSDIQTKKNDVDTSHTLITKLETEIKTKNTEVSKSVANISNIEKKCEVLITSSEESEKLFSGLADKISEQAKLNEENLTEIKNTLEAANRVGMANSFYERKKELRLSLVLWGVVFVLAITAIFISGIYFIKPYLDKQPSTLSLELLAKFLLVSPLVWLAWMSARQYGFISRIREDYAFKFASAMAFEGYKKQAHEIDETMEQQLLQISLIHMSQNPIRIYSSNDNHASPLNEIVKDLSSSLLSRLPSKSKNEP